MNRELVSALADGQLRGEEFSRTVEWVEQTEDAGLTWRAYHVVGDVLRSHETIDSARDAAFMARLKLGLRQELAHLPIANATNLIAGYEGNTGATGLNGLRDSSANESSFRWKLLAGVASLAAVAVVGWQASSGSGEQRGASQLAQVSAQTVKPEVSLAPTVVAGEPQVMIRDPQLDALLAAHKQFGGMSALEMPSGFLRNATFEGAVR